MSTYPFPNVDLRELGRRLQQARKARGFTQQDSADRLGVARTTVTAIEKGERRIQAEELTKLAELYGSRVGDLLRQPSPDTEFAVQLRAVLAASARVEEDLTPFIDDFQRLCEDYLELERVCSAPLPRRYPQPYEISGVSPERAGEDAANAERLRLGLGDGPIADIRDLLESDVGIRIFYMDLPSRTAAMFGYTEELGGCIAINRKHPAERRRLSSAHEYGHFISRRYEPEIAVLKRYQRVPEHERFAESFAHAFLMPASGLSRRYSEIHRSRGGRITPADLCRLAELYQVSLEALTLRLEELRLLPSATWDRLKERGFRVREAQAILGISPPSDNDDLLPLRYRYLAVEAYQRGDLTEGQLARFLRTDRLEARRIANEMATGETLNDQGEIGPVQLELAMSVAELRGA
ncbi:MAG TPA: XRE family transcriptional regulator [Longimicrobium sp.]|jgi:Zn-dependent peptidase ImmA (M78 family)/DNA-binding XRE family transcriptional regulator